MKIVAATLAVIALFVGVLYLGYQFNWWLKEKDVNHQVNLDNHQKGTQSAWRDEARRDVIDALELPENTPARAAVTRQACSLIDRLVPTYLDPDLSDFKTQEC